MNTIQLTLLIAVTLGAAAVRTQAAGAQEIWDKQCASCHAKDGSGNTRMGKQTGARDYRDAKVQSEISDESAFKAMKEGITDKGKERMKPFKDKLSEEEMKALLALIRGFKK